MDKRLGLTFSVLLLTLAIGTFGFRWTEHIGIWQAFYLTVETITTVGYGDIPVKTGTGQIISVIMMLGGVGISLYFVGLVMAFVIEGHLADVYGRRKMMRKISELKEHVIVCGGGRVGRQVLYRLRKEAAPCVLIETDEGLVQEYLQDGFLALHGDATQDDMLKRAGIDKAKGLITALPEDSLNVFVTLTAKGLNSSIHVVARMDKLESENKLMRAGADKVISPAILSGWRMAMAFLKPVSVEYIDTLIHDHNIPMEIKELKIAPNSCLIGKTLASSMIKERTGVLVLAIARNQQVLSNPAASVEIFEEDVLIVTGLREQLQRLEEVAANRKALVY